MANEAKLRVKTGLPIQFKCSDGTGIEKGALVYLSGDMTVALATTDDQVMGGIVAGEKIASNGQLYVPVYREGIFQVKLSGTGTRGDLITIEGDTTNCFKAANASNTSGNRIWGVALESWTTGQTKYVQLHPLGATTGKI